MPPLAEAVRDAPLFLYYSAVRIVPAYLRHRIARGKAHGFAKMWPTTAYYGASVPRRMLLTAESGHLRKWRWRGCLMSAAVCSI